MREERILQILETIFFIVSAGNVESATPESFSDLRAKLEALSDDELAETGFKVMEIAVRTMKQLSEIESDRNKTINRLEEETEKSEIRKTAIQELETML